MIKTVISKIHTTIVLMEVEVRNVDFRRILARVVQKIDRKINTNTVAQTAQITLTKIGIFTLKGRTRFRMCATEEAFTTL